MNLLAQTIDQPTNNSLPIGLLIGLAGLVIILFLLLRALRLTQEYERGIVFRLGRVKAEPRGPGLFLVVPFGIDRVVKIDLRTVTLEIPQQETITRDNVSVRVNAVLYFRVFNPIMALVNVFDYRAATYQIAQTSLRSVVGQSELDELLSKREHINQRLQDIIDQQTEPWGIKVSTVEIKDVELPEQLKRALAKQAEAEREKRAKIINAEGEFQASKQLALAAKELATQPVSVQLRFLQVLSEIATEKNSTIIFPVPVDLISTFMESSAKTMIAGANRSDDTTPAPNRLPAMPGTNQYPPRTN